MREKLRARAFCNVELPSGAARRWHGGLFFGRRIKSGRESGGDKWVSRYMRLERGFRGSRHRHGSRSEGRAESVIGRPEQRTKGGRVPGRACQLGALLKGNTHDTWNKRVERFVSRFIIRVHGVRFPVRSKLERPVRLTRERDRERA